MKQLSTDLAVTLLTFFDSVEVKSVVEATKGASDTDTGTFEMVITTENIDRYNEVIKLDGWDLTHYLKNGVVLWGHDHNLIIGLTTSLMAVNGQLIAKGKFAPTPFAQEKRMLYDAGFLQASSVGFIEKEREGNLITKAELIEWSFVSVPANPYALSLAMEKGMSINELFTKGIFTLREADAEVTAPVTTPVEPVLETPVEPEPVEKSFNTKAISPIVSQLRAVVDALEALDTPEPERVDDEPVAPTEDEKALLDFNDKRRIIQEAATIFGDVLADARKAIEARRS